MVDWNQKGSVSAKLSWKFSSKYKSVQITANIYQKEFDSKYTYTNGGGRLQSDFEVLRCFFVVVGNVSWLSKPMQCACPITSLLHYMPQQYWECDSLLYSIFTGVFGGVGNYGAIRVRTPQLHFIL